MRLRWLLSLVPPACLGAVLVPLACGPDAPADRPEARSDDAGWDHVRVPYDSGVASGPPRVPVAAEVISNRVDTKGLMFAASEMQISGEPFAESFAGRDLGRYDRTYLPPDQYLVGDPKDPTPITDLFGFSTAVESYEYSKYHMNMLVQQTGAGVSLANGPLVARAAGATATDRLRAYMAQLLGTAGADVAGYVTLPAPSANPLNVLGFPGLAPVFAPFTAFDPAMEPHRTIVRSCTFAGGYGGIPSLGQMVPEYECEYNSLHLTHPEGTEPVIVPAVIGLATWKQALWAIDFTGRLHDKASNPVDEVAESDRPNVGKASNTVTGTAPEGAAAGTYVGSTPLEGMWGLTMLAHMDNAAEWLLGSLTTQNGTALGGFGSKRDALSYDYTTPPRWFPTAVRATVDDTPTFPALTGLAIDDAASRSEDLAGLLLGYSMFFGMTDARNAAIGQSLGLQLSFDGDPFAADNGLPDGEETPHDRALAVLRVAFVDLDRLHADPALGVLADTARVSGTTVTREDVVTTTSLAHALIALRQTLLSLNAAITQYGAADPDPAADAQGILNALPIHPPGAGTPTFSGRVRDVFVRNARFVRDTLTQPDGRVAVRATLSGGVATAATDATTLEAQAAALRALTEGFLVTGDETFRDRARAVARRLLSPAFYSAPARMFRGVDGGRDEVHMGPERFAWLQSALRETHKVLFVQGDDLLDRSVLEDRIARVNKLFLNGWDDVNGNQVVDKPSECLAGRLQQAEQSLTGELGRDDLLRAAEDRDGDCVLELAHAQTASVLASDVLFHSP